MHTDSSKSVVDVSQKHDLDSTHTYLGTDSSTRGNKYHLERIDLRPEEKELYPSKDGIEVITKIAKLNEPLRTAYMRNPRTDFFRIRLLETTLYFLPWVFANLAW